MTSATLEQTSMMANTRSLLEKAVGGGITPAESIFLAGELARLTSRMARVNARIGGEVVSLSPYAKVSKDIAAVRLQTA